MDRASIIAAFCALAAAAVPVRAGAFTEDSPVTARIAVSRDTVAVFLLPSQQSAHDPTAVGARAGVRSALARAKACLGKEGVDYLLIFARRIVVESAERTDTFEVGDSLPSMGALLARPGSHTRIIYVTGSQALAQGLPLAVQDYFGRRC